jgi:NAD(P)-dependent dehydrogenase (short-subunit alcohol dehydrogenase family)
MQDLEGKVAFVTGGASGIGLGIAHALAGAGMKLVIADLRQDHIDEALEDFRQRQHGRDVHAIRLDVTDRKAMAEAADEAERVFGKVHVLVNNAGVGIEGPFGQAAYDDWDFGLGVNLGGVINGIQTFVPRIRAHGGGGHVVSTASLAGLAPPKTNFAIYSTAKAAIVGLMESIRADLAADGIGASVLCPGPVKSRIHELKQNRPEGFTASPAFQAAADKLAGRQVSELWMDPDKVGDMVVRGIRNDELYIITHGELRERMEQRFKAILDALPTEVDPNLLASMPSRRS